MVGGHPQRVEHAAQCRIRPQRQALRMRGDLVKQMKAVIALRVAVDDPRTLQETLVLELLSEGRLARSERSHAENGRVAVAVRSLPQVEPDRPSGAGQRVP